MKLKNVIEKLERIRTITGDDAIVFVNDADGGWSPCSKYSEWLFCENAIFIPPSHLGAHTKNRISEDDFLEEKYKIEALY